MERRVIVVVSEYNGISVSLVEKFLSNFFSVKVICAETDLWRKYAPYLFSNNYFSVALYKDKKEFTSNFSVFVSCFYDNLSSYKEKKIFLNEEERFLYFLSRVISKRRKFVVLPYQVYEKIGLGIAEIYNRNINLEGNKNLYICFVDEVVGPRVVLSSRSETCSLLRPLFVPENSVFVSRQVYVKACLLGDFSRRFVSFVLNSKGVEERKILFSGSRIDRLFLLEVLREKKEVFSERLEEIVVNPQKAIFDLEIKPGELLDKRKLIETINWFRKNRDEFFIEGRGKSVGGKKEVFFKEKRESVFSKKSSARSVFLGDQTKTLFRKSKKLFAGKGCVGVLWGGILNVLKRMISGGERRKADPKINLLPAFKSKFSSLYLRLSFLFLFFVFVFPALLLVLSALLFYLGYRFFGNFNLSGAMFFVNASEKISYLLSENYYGLAKFPLFGNYYLFLGESLSLIHSSSRTFNLGISLAKNVPFICERSLKGQEIDLVSFSRSLFLDLNSLYFQASLLEGNLDILGRKYVFLRPLSSKLDFSKYRQVIASVKEMALLLPEVLGDKEEKRYLVLFQNNMELRATGGFIGSFAILTFRKGALTNLEVYDVYTADGQLKGYVEPPWQIRVYLDQPAWYLRDSNWDPDFSVSARRAEWFLDKSMGIKVDGVFSFDITFVKDLISVVGQLNILDYNKTIDDKIFYDVVQYEVEKDFFSGSRQKANFLTALSKSLLFEIRDANPKTLLSFLPVFYRNLSERHLQLFFSDGVLQEKINFLGWGGGLKQDLCFSKNCFEDFVAVVESNFGVNKANYFVSRSVNLKVDVEDSFLRREMEISFENKAPLVLGDKGRYKNYLRVFVPGSSVVEKVLVEDNNSFEVNPDQADVRGMREIGFLVEVLPESAKKVVVIWKEEKPFSLSENGEYRVVFRKQAGVDEIFFEFKLKFPSGFKVASDNLRLTKEGFFIYNQPYLRRDFSERFYW